MAQGRCEVSRTLFVMVDHDDSRAGMQKKLDYGRTDSATRSTDDDRATVREPWKYEFMNRRKFELHRHSGITSPPLTRMIWPVIYEAASEARKAIAVATSLARPGRPRGISALCSLSTAFCSSSFSVPSAFR